MGTIIAPSRVCAGAAPTLFAADDFVLTVTGVQRITDHYLRIIFRDGGLLSAHPISPTMWLRIWFEEYGTLRRPAYSLVDPNPVAGTFALEFAFHGGAADRWAQSVHIGDKITATMMSSTFNLPKPETDGWLIAGDPTSLPAINSLLDAIAASDAPDVPVIIWMEYQYDDDFTLPLRSREHQCVEWIQRGLDGRGLVDTVAADAFKATGYHGWIATEMNSTLAINALMIKEFGLAHNAIKYQAYWV